jgi:hypothetical protein
MRARGPARQCEDGGSGVGMEYAHSLWMTYRAMLLFTAAGCA